MRFFRVDDALNLSSVIQTTFNISQHLEKGRPNRFNSIGKVYPNNTRVIEVVEDLY